ncbi:MAG: HEAT repeat domain-containing protein, partial [Planctomycetota bacterium]
PSLGACGGAAVIAPPQRVLAARLDDTRARADALAGRASEALEQLAASGRTEMGPAVDGLLAAIDGRRDGIAIPALGAIGTIGGPEHVDPLLAVLGDESNSDEVRIAAADAIGEIGGRHDLAEAVSSSMRSVFESDASLELRVAAARALGRMSLGAPSRAGLLETVRVNVGAADSE